MSPEQPVSHPASTSQFAERFAGTPGPLAGRLLGVLLVPLAGLLVALVALPGAVRRRACRG